MTTSVPSRLPPRGAQGWWRALWNGHDRRLRHVLYAAVLSLLAAVTLITDPIDQVAWTLQSRMVSAPASGQNIIVSADDDLTDPRYPERRMELARALRELDAAGVGRVVVTPVFDQPSTPAADTALRDAVRAFRGEVVFGVRVVRPNLKTASSAYTLQTIREKRPQAAVAVITDYFGYAWRVSGAITVGRQTYPTVTEVLHPTAAHLSYFVYLVKPEALPTATLQQVEATRTSKLCQDTCSSKTVIIGQENGAGAEYFDAPGSIQAPKFILPVVAAENIQQLSLRPVDGVIVAIITALLFALSVCIASRAVRRGCYGSLALLATVLLLTGAHWGIFANTSVALFFVGCFAAFRRQAHRRAKAGYTDPRTGLPTFAVLEAKLADLASGYLVTAKVHGFENVLKSLPGNHRQAYILKLVERLRAHDPSLALFGEGHLFAWILGDQDERAIIDHLEGLRALFGAPIILDGTKIDVGVTFGLAPIGGTSGNALHAAAAAAEATNEAHNPIVVSEDAGESELLWNISMRARIDAAMEAGELYCLYQPKFDAQSGEVFGVEALLRWQDPERGQIPPDVFIQQCENAGRMEDLTRYVLQSACSAGRLLHARDHYLAVAVNISAIMLNTHGVVQLVEQVLLATRFDPRYLILEITETARIADLDRAAETISRLKQLGIHVSMDDFGVGAANFEALLRLPFDELKIDRMFVSNMLEQPKARAIAASLVAMGNAANISVVAEGVETREQLELLIAMGCNQVQGYALSRPITLQRLLELVDNTVPGSVNTAV